MWTSKCQIAHNCNNMYFHESRYVYEVNIFVSLYKYIYSIQIQRTQSEVVADKRLICSSALSAINASSRFVIHFSVRVTFLPRVLTDGSTFFSIFSCTFCSTFFSSVLRECFFTHFFQYFFEYFSEYSPARVLFLVLFRVLFWVISCESTFWSIFFSFLSLLSVQLLLPPIFNFPTDLFSKE